MELAPLLTAAQIDSVELVSAWSELRHPSPVLPRDLVLRTVQRLCAAVANQRYQVSGCTGMERHVLATLCTRLTTLDAVLALGDPTIAAESAAFICVQLEVATEALAKHSAALLLRPFPPLSDADQDLMLLRLEALRLPALLLARCIGADKVRARELLGLGRGDIALTVAVAVATMAAAAPEKTPAATLGAAVMAGRLRLPTSLWLALCQLSTPQFAAELLGQTDDSRLNDAPIEALVDAHVEHAHRLALSFVQFDALRTVCSCAEQSPSPQLKASLIGACLRTLHNLVASPHLIAPSRLIARQMVVLWPRFGFRILAPHLRRLLGTAEVGGSVSSQAARDLRRELRTLGWLLHHSPELREQMRPICVELAMKAARSEQLLATCLAVFVGVAANAGALLQGSLLYSTLEAIAEDRKVAVCEVLPPETNRLWIIREAWAVVESLGFWPRSCLDSSEEIAVAMAAAVSADAAAIAKLQPWSQDGAGITAFNFLDNPHWEDGETEAGAVADDEEAEEEEDDEEMEAAGGSASGPLGLLSVSPPPPPPVAQAPAGGLCSPARLLCEAPDELRCAIDGRLCQDPVRAPTGILYERSSILAWLKWNKVVCPVSGTPLSPTELVDDTASAESTNAWIEWALSSHCNG